MLVLAIDSSATASVALGKVGATGEPIRLLGYVATEDTRSHAEIIVPFVERVLTEANASYAELGAVLCGTGPGPFTGLRVGIMTARTIGFAHSIPVYGLMSLTALAEQVATLARARGENEILVATDARRREIYSAQYFIDETGYRLTSGPTVGSAADTPAYPAYGKGAGLYPKKLNTVTGCEDLQPRADYLLAAAARTGIANLSTDTSPLYLRDSDAKVLTTYKKAGAHAQP